jgi:hypothetical protein
MATALVLLVFFALHQDLWFWREARPLVFGVLPVGLAWHAAYTLAVSVIMAVLVRRSWPSHLEEAAEDSGAGRAAPGPRAGSRPPGGGGA